MCKLKYESKSVKVLKNKDIRVHLSTSGCKELCFYSGLPRTPDFQMTASFLSPTWFVCVPESTFPRAAKEGSEPCNCTTVPHSKKKSPTGVGHFWGSVLAHRSAGIQVYGLCCTYCQARF